MFYMDYDASWVRFLACSPLSRVLCKVTHLRSYRPRLEFECHAPQLCSYWLSRKLPDRIGGFLYGIHFL